MKNSFLAVTAFSALMLAGCARRPEVARPAVSRAGRAGVTLSPAQRARLQIETVAPTSFHATVTATGTVGFDADRATTVLAPISGPVARVLVSLGARVKAGEPLAEVNSPDYATALSGYRKALVTARNLDRIARLDQQLFQADAIARRDLQQAQTDAANADADRDAALQQLRAIGVPESVIHAIEQNRPAPAGVGIIRAPLTGTVVEKMISPGQLLQTGSTPCFTIADLSQVWVATSIFESQLASVTVGDPAEVYTDAGTRAFAGRVDNIGAILDPNTRAVAVRVVARNPRDFLKKGMYVRVVIRSKRATTGIVVPVAAVLRDAENLPFVYVVAPDGAFERRSVTLGTQLGNRYVVTSGLQAGDRIIGQGGLYVQFQQNQ